MSSLRLSPQVFLILSRAIEDHTGIHYREGDAEILASKMTPRAEALGFESLLDYYYFIRYDPRGPEELDALTELLVVNETYFFREVEPLAVLIDTFLAPRIAAGKKVRVWSAACSTGEEPLSLAMLLAQRGLLSQVEIVASDISDRVLDRARRGVYNGRSLRALPHPAMGSWLSMSGEVDSAIVRAIEWKRVNLLDTAAVHALGSFDAVLMRNVLIYFTDETTRTVVDHALSSLHRDGVLLVGVSESLLRLGPSLRCEEHGGYFFYRRAQS